VCGHAQDMDVAGIDLDHEEHVQAAQEHGIDVEEVGGEGHRSLPGQERPPGLPGPPGGQDPMPASLSIFQTGSARAERGVR